MNWDYYYSNLMHANSSSPEQALICAVFERVLRDLGVLGTDTSVNYQTLKDTADYVFDEPSGDEPWTFRWVLQHVRGLGDEEEIITRLREFVLDYWTVRKVRRLVYGRRTKKTSKSEDSGR